MKMRKHIKNYKDLYLTGILSAVLFLCIYGVKILNPLYTDWLLAGGDLSQHYLGFALFKNAPWQLQLGMMNTAAYPFSESIIFTDSIPCAAVLGKLAAGLYSGAFQYFGLWGLLCFILQGVLVCLLLRKYTDNLFFLVTAGLFFVLSPILLRRMFWHTSLASHFVILLALLFLVYREELSKNHVKTCLAFGGLGILCSFVHIYFLAMCFPLLVCFVLLNFHAAKEKNLKAFFFTLLPLLVYILSALLSILLLGGFSSGMDDGAPGLGFYSFNLNGFFNPQDWSSLLPNLPVYADGQYEGFAYLGLGGILLFLSALFLLLFCLFKQKPSLKELCTVKISWIFYGITAVLLLLAAASEQISFCSGILFTLPVPKWMLSLWGTFRASGRLIWPSVYMLLLFSFLVILRTSPKRLMYPLLLCCLLLQMLDLKDMLLTKHREFTKTVSYESELKDSFWTTILTERELQHIVFYDKDNLTQEQLYSFAEYAALNHLTINDFYFARALSYPIQEVAKDFFHHPDDATIYVMTYESYLEHRQYELSYYTHDGLIIGLKTSYTSASR